METQSDSTEINVDHKAKEYNGHTDDDWEEHPILFSLLNALLPDVELQGWLLLIWRVSECHYVLDQPIIDAFQIIGLHQKQALESLTEVEGTAVHRVLAFVHQVKHLNDDWVL